MPSMRRYFQFRLSTILLVTMACAIVFSGYRQWQQSQENLKLRTWLEDARDYREHSVAIEYLLRSFDLEKPEDREALAYFQRIVRTEAISPVASRHTFSRHGRPLTLITVATSPITSDIPGVETSAAYLIKGFPFINGRLIDYLGQTKSPREAFFELSVGNLEDLATADVSFSSKHGREFAGSHTPGTRHYRITAEGFEPMNEPE